MMSEIMITWLTFIFITIAIPRGSPTNNGPGPGVSPTSPRASATPPRGSK
jgi:hypothetical protein